jgi:hypothetical protein
VSDDRTDFRNEGQGPAHEPDALNVRGVVFAAIALALFVVVVAVLMGALEELFTGRPRAGAQRAARRVAPQPTLAAPVLDPNQPRELHELRAAEKEQLESYGWVDRDAGIARIPIARAIALLAEKRVPLNRPTTKTPAAAEAAKEKPAQPQAEEKP